MGVVALAGREDRDHHVLEGAGDRIRRDVEPVQRGADQEAAIAEVAPHGDLVFAKASLELVDPIQGDIQDDRDRLHRRTLPRPGSVAWIARHLLPWSGWLDADDRPPGPS
jgi:hypothetical protein